mmetsp:Transcript_34918/g.110307  ORF Transcript_34918/g.110307 Transcript_34918/m.110307 type:complete len:238 (-) Transcript_34918:136-849(-)
MQGLRTGQLSGAQGRSAYLPRPWHAPQEATWWSDLRSCRVVRSLPRRGVTQRGGGGGRPPGRPWVIHPVKGLGAKKAPTSEGDEATVLLHPRALFVHYPVPRCLKLFLVERPELVHLLQRWRGAAGVVMAAHRWGGEGLKHLTCRQYTSAPRERRASTTATRRFFHLRQLLGFEWGNHELRVYTCARMFQVTMRRAELAASPAGSHVASITGCPGAAGGQQQEVAGRGRNAREVRRG